MLAQYCTKPNEEKCEEVDSGDDMLGKSASVLVVNLA